MKDGLLCSVIPESEFSRKRNRGVSPRAHGIMVHQGLVQSANEQNRLLNEFGTKIIDN